MRYAYAWIIAVMARSWSKNRFLTTSLGINRQEAKHSAIDYDLYQDDPVGAWLFLKYLLYLLHTFSAFAEASDQRLICLLTYIFYRFVKIWLKMKKIPTKTLKTEMDWSNR